MARAHDIGGVKGLGRARGSRVTEDAVTTMAGAAALPRKNGELVFEAPWEGRAFGIAVALNEAGAFEWEAFRQRLIAEIEGPEHDDGSRYYERWLASLERVLLDGGVISASELAARADQLAAADEHEHDHDHDEHDHHHDAHDDGAHGHDDAHTTREVTA